MHEHLIRFSFLGTVYQPSMAWSMAVAGSIYSKRNYKKKPALGMFLMRVLAVKHLQGD